MDRSLITSTVIGTSAVIGALAFSAGGGSCTDRQLRCFPTAGIKGSRRPAGPDPWWWWWRVTGRHGWRWSRFRQRTHGVASPSPMTPTSPMQAAPLPRGVLSHARPTAGLPGRMLRQARSRRRRCVRPRPRPLRHRPSTTMSNSRSSAAAAAALAAALGTSGIPPAHRIGSCRRQKSHNPSPSSLPSRRSRRSCQLNSPPAEPCSQTWRCRRTPPPRPARVNRHRARPAVAASRSPTAWGSGIGRHI